MGSISDAVAIGLLGSVGSLRGDARAGAAVSHGVEGVDGRLRDTLSRDPVTLVQVCLAPRLAARHLAHAAADDAAGEPLLCGDLAGERPDATVDVVPLDRDGRRRAGEQFGEVVARR